MIQFEENPVEILIVSEDPEEFERYVKGRPGLRDFFGLIYETPFGTVKKSVPANASYGTIRFYPLHLRFHRGYAVRSAGKTAKRRSAFRIPFSLRSHGIPETAIWLLR